MIDETFDYKGYHVQRMTKDFLWYVTFENKIVYWHQYRNDIRSWIDARAPIVQQNLSCNPPDEISEDTKNLKE